MDGEPLNCFSPRLYLHLFPRDTANLRSTPIPYCSPHLAPKPRTTFVEPVKSKMKISAVLLVAGAALLAFAAAEESPKERQLSGRGRGKRSRDSSSDSSSSDDGCADPAQAILDLFDCFEAEDVPCVVASYDPNFETYHNELLAATDLQCKRWREDGLFFAT